MLPTFFDSHCHFDFAEFDQQRETLWSDCHALGVQQLLIPGIQPSQWNTAYELAELHSGIVTAAGLHPWWVKSATLPSTNDWLNSLQRDHCVAIGECGLDAAIDTPLDLQHAVFEAHLKLAVECNMPLIIHVRQTHQQTLQLLKRYRPPSGGVIHGFTGSKELALSYWEMGFHLGIGGSITYERAHKTREAVKALPLESLLLETDAPDMPLSGFQGQANSPTRIVSVASVLAELRGETLERIAHDTTQNSQRLFKLP